MSASISKPKAAPKIGAERMYQCILSPLVTEKATVMSEKGQYAFRVTMDASKPEIKQAVEGLFGVNVLAVNTLVMKGKAKRFGKTMGRRKDWKKAFVCLKPGQEINFAAGE